MKWKEGFCLFVLSINNCQLSNNSSDLIRSETICSSRPNSSGESVEKGTVLKKKLSDF